MAPSPAHHDQQRAQIQRSSSVSAAPQNGTTDSQLRIIISGKREDLPPLSTLDTAKQTPLIRSYSSKLIHPHSPLSIQTAPVSFNSHLPLKSYYLPPFPAMSQLTSPYPQQTAFNQTPPVHLHQQSTYLGHPKSYEPIRISSSTEQRPIVASSIPRPSRDSEASVSLSTAHYSVQRMAPLRSEVRSEAITLAPVETPRSTQPAPVFGLQGGNQLLIESQKRIVLLSMENVRLAAKAQDYEQAFVEMRAKINSLEVQLQDYERLANEYGRLKERSDSLESRMQEALEERSQFLSEIEQLQSTSKRSRAADSEAEELREQNQNLADENNKLHSKFTLLVAENSRLQSITHENEDLRNQLFALTQDRNKLAADHRDLKQQLDTARDSSGELTALKNKLVMLVSENELLQGMRPEAASLKARISQLEADLAPLHDLKRENSDLRDALLNMEAEISRLQTAPASDHPHQLQTVHPAASLTQQQQRTLARSQPADSKPHQEASDGDGSELDALRTQVEGLQAENDSLRLEINTSRVEFEQIVLDLDKRLQSVSHQGDEIEPLKRSFGALSHERDELHRKLVQAQNEHNQLEARNKMLQTELENERKTLAVLHQRCEMYEKDSQEMRARLQEPDAPLSRSGHLERPTESATAASFGNVQSQLDEVSEENRQLKAEITDLDELLLNKDHDIEEVSKYSKYLEGELGEARTQLVEKETEIGKLIDEMKLLQQRMGSSRSDNLISSK